jgi:hypothetical protein
MTAFCDRERSSDPDIHFSRDGNPLLHEEPFYDSSFRSGLVRHQPHSKDLLRVHAHLFDAFRYFHATSFAPPPGMDLGFHDPHAAAKRLGNALGLIDRHRLAPFGNGDAVLLQISLP